MEMCDDSNILPNDGCGPTCKLEISAVAKVTNIAKVIPDNAYTGAKASMLCVNLVINDVGTVKDATVQVGLDHPWLGDLTFKVFSPADAKIVTLMSLPGTLEALDNGASASPESSDLQKLFPVIFRSMGVKDAETMGNTLGGTAAVCKDDGQCDYKPNPGKGPGINLTDFAGVASNGTWMFCAADSAGGDVGTLDAVTLTLMLQ